MKAHDIDWTLWMTTGPQSEKRYEQKSEHIETQPIYTDTHTACMKRYKLFDDIVVVGSRSVQTTIPTKLSDCPAICQVLPSAQWTTVYSL